MDQIDLFDKTREIDRILDCGVAAAVYRNGLALIESTVACCAIGDALAREFFLAVYSEVAVGGSDCKDNCLGCFFAAGFELYGEAFFC